MAPKSKLRLNSIPEEPCYHPQGQNRYPTKPLEILPENMHGSVCFEDLGQTAQPFNDAAYRQWEREFDRDLNNKPLPPLPRVPQRAQLQIDQPQRVVHSPLPQVQHPSPTILPMQYAQRPKPLSGELFSPLRENHSSPHSVWKRRAERMALTERVRKEDPEFKSMWSPVTAEEEKEKSKCCCVI